MDRPPGCPTRRRGDEATILRFRHLLDKHDLATDMLRVVNDLLQHKGLLLRTGTAVDATLISAPSSTKNDGERDPEMKQTKKGNNWYFGLKAHIGVDVHSGLVHTVATTPANVNDLNVAGQLLHGDEHAAFGDAGYQGVHKRPEAAGPTWHVAMRPRPAQEAQPVHRARLRRRADGEDEGPRGLLKSARCARIASKTGADKTSKASLGAYYVSSLVKR